METVFEDLASNIDKFILIMGRYPGYMILALSLAPTKIGWGTGWFLLHLSLFLSSPCFFSLLAAFAAHHDLYDTFFLFPFTIHVSMVTA